MAQRITAEIAPAAPYDFELTAGQPNYSRGQEYKTEDFADGAYIRLLDLGERTALATVRSAGTVEQPRLSVELVAPDDLGAGDLASDGLTADDVRRAVGQLEWLLGCDQDLRPFYDAAAGDAVLGEVVQQFYGYRSTRTASVFEGLAQAIMGQQIAASVARVVRSLLVQRYGVRALVDGQEWYAFPRAGTLAGAEVSDLRQLKLSGRKSEYIRGIAQAAVASPEGLEELHRLPDDAVVKALTELRGVGHWTAQWALVRALGRPDGFPVGDLALRRTVSQLYFEGAGITDAELLRFSERWSPWRSYATAYLFAALRAGRVAGG